MWSAKFWKETAERAIKSAAQAGILVIGIAEGFNLFELDVYNFTGAIAGGAVLSLLTSIGSSPFSRGDSPDLSGSR